MCWGAVNFLSESVGIMVIDIGVHALPKIPGSHLLVQVAVPGLEERTRAPSLSDVNTLLVPGSLLPCPSWRYACGACAPTPGLPDVMLTLMLGKLAQTKISPTALHVKALEGCACWSGPMCTPQDRQSALQQQIDALQDISRHQLLRTAP